MSVNWEDDASVEAFTLRQTNAQHGAARVSTAFVLSFNRDISTAPPPLLCERAEREGNPHHGSVVYSKSVSKNRERQIAGSLALHSILVRRHSP